MAAIVFHDVRNQIVTISCPSVSCRWIVHYKPQFLVFFDLLANLDSAECGQVSGFAVLHT